MGTSKQVFFVTSDRLVVYRWHNGHFDAPLVYLSDHQGVAQLSRYLKQAPRHPAYMLVDLVEEEFREDTMPHVLGSNRRALIQSKQRRLFRTPTYSHAIFQSRQSEGRRDDEMLFTALTNPEILSAWMAPIAEHKIALTGIYSLPLVSRQLYNCLRIESSRALMVSRQSAGGLRQTYFLDGRLKLSRLAMLPSDQDNGDAAKTLDEVEKTRRYLDSLPTLTRDTPLDVHLLGDERFLMAVEEQLIRSTSVRYHLHDLSDLARRLKLKEAYRSCYADRIFTHLLARSSPPNHYASGEQRKNYRMYKVGAGLRGISLALLTVSGLLSGLNVVEALSAGREAASVGEHIRFYHDGYRRAHARLPDTPAAARDMRQAVVLADSIRGLKAWPLPMWLAISERLNVYPKLKIDTLDWQSSLHAGSRLREGQHGSARVLFEPQRSGHAIDGRVGEGERKLYQLALVKGRVVPFSGNYREALEMVGNFADALRAQPAVAAVEVLALPLDIGSENRLAGTTSPDLKRVDAPFQIEIVLWEPELATR